MTEVVLQHDRRLGLLGDLEIAGNLTAIGFSLPVDVTYDQFEAIGRMFGAAHEALKFAIGDWLVQGEMIFDHQVYQAAEGVGISKVSLSQYVRVAERIPGERRHEALTWSHHRAVCSLEPDEQDVWLNRAEVSEWSKTELEDHLRAQREELPAKPEYVRPGGAVEAVLMAAADVWAAVRPASEDGWVLVRIEAVQKLAKALGES